MRSACWAYACWVAVEHLNWELSASLKVLLLTTLVDCAPLVEQAGTRALERTVDT